MENRKPLRKQFHPVLKFALWGAAVPTVLTLCVQAARLYWPSADGLLFILGRPTEALEEAMGFATVRWPRPWVEIYLLPYAVNAAIGGVVLALPAAFLELVDYSTKPPPK